jgi:hypothetical protein
MIVYFTEMNKFKLISRIFQLKMFCLCLSVYLQYVCTLFVNSCFMFFTCQMSDTYS